VRRALAGVTCLAVLGTAACGGGSQPPWTGALPSDPGDLASHLTAADRAWRHAAAVWIGRDRGRGEPPAALTQPGGYVQRAVEQLSRQPGLALATTRRLPARLAAEVRELTAARRDELRLAAGFSGAGVELNAPTPLPWLLRSYREAARRFGVDWHVLAAVNLVESRFGRATGNSSAGAQGPMQFIPSTWRRYGLGGNVFDPHDAVIGAANFLGRSGAPASYRSALYAYNPSLLYVDAVLRYARVTERDRGTLYLLYSWD
jgi:soluble lytic murein transglycosylase-like protein